MLVAPRFYPAQRHDRSYEVAAGQKHFEVDRALAAAPAGPTIKKLILRPDGEAIVARAAHRARSYMFLVPLCQLDIRVRR
jgi:hypothetical protein